jgi:uncharacterized membrane protein
MALTRVQAPRSLAHVEGLLAFGAGALLIYRGITGRWPSLVRRSSSDDTKRALGGEGGVHVKASQRLDVPVSVVYRYWRRLENLPQFMTHLDSVTETTSDRSHWVAIGPAGLRFEWDAEIINDRYNSLLAWRSLPGADVVNAGSVNFHQIHDGRGTQVDVHLQYDPPGGKVGAGLATLLGSNPAKAIREDLRRFKQILEAGGRPS